MKKFPKKLILSFPKGYSLSQIRRLIEYHQQAEEAKEEFREDSYRELSNATDTIATKQQIMQNYKNFINEILERLKEE